MGMLHTYLYLPFPAEKVPKNEQNSGTEFLEIFLFLPISKNVILHRQAQYFQFRHCRVLYFKILRLGTFKKTLCDFQKKKKALWRDKIFEFVSTSPTLQWYYQPSSFIYMDSSAHASSSSATQEAEELLGVADWAAYKQFADILRGTPISMSSKGHPSFSNISLQML